MKFRRAKQVRSAQVQTAAGPTRVLFCASHNHMSGASFGCRLGHSRDATLQVFNGIMCYVWLCSPSQEDRLQYAPVVLLLTVGFTIAVP